MPPRKISGARCSWTRNNPDLNNNYGWFLCQTGREREAVGYFQRALRDPLYATPARASLSAGVCLMRIKRLPGR